MKAQAAALALAALLAAAAAQHRFAVAPLPSAFAPSPRADHLTVVLQSQDGFLVIVHGGRDAAGAKSDTWIYVVAQDRWRLLAAPALADSARPPPLWGAVGGYRFVAGRDFPFLYVTLGCLEGGALTNEMWVMEFENFTWRRVELDGELPAPRYGAVGSLERFVKPDGGIEPALIVSHGRGERGPLSDTYKCSFDKADPYRATWRRFRPPVGQYSTRAPHPVWLQASTFTAARDVVMFGGCYASEHHGGICPSRLAWLLKYDPEKTVSNVTQGEAGEEASVPGVEFEPETDTMTWRTMPSGPAPRTGATMAQGLNAFEGAYESHEGIAILYGGSQDTADLPVDQVLSMSKFDGSEVDILSTTSRTWLRERVHYSGPQEFREDTLARRKGATLSIVRNATDEELEHDTPTEFYLLFGGQFENGSFTNAMLQLSFDPFVESESIEEPAWSTPRPFVHGILMFISWGVLMVVGAYSSRYMEQADRKSRYFVFHVGTQVLALAIAWGGVGLVVYGRRRTSAWFAHGQIGLVLITLASVQPVVAVIGIVAQLRSTPLQSAPTLEGAKIKLTLVPRLCRIYHRVVGLAIIVLGSVNITLGLFLIVAPTIVWVHWIVYSCLLCICMVLLEVIGGRQAAEALQTRASSMNRGVSAARTSRGSSYVGRLVRSLRGDSMSITIQMQRGRSYVDEAGVPAEDDIPPVASVEEMLVPAEDHIPPTASAEEMIMAVQAEKGTVPVQSSEAISFNEPSTSVPNSTAVEFQERLESNTTAVEFRERLESGISSVFTYRDPDTY